MRTVIIELFKSGYMKIIWRLIVIFQITVSLGCNIDTPVDKSKLLGDDYRLFQNTPIWGLAKAVRKGDTIRIKSTIANGEDPNFADPRFGGTLLMMAIRNNSYISVLALLEHGANPNQGNVYRGTTAMHYAAENDDPKYLKLLLSYKGNPNAIEAPPKRDGDGLSETVLNSAISFSGQNVMQKVELLVGAGADVNSLAYNTEVKLPIADAIMNDKMDVLLYLLKHGADYHKVLYKTVDGTDVYILKALRACLFDLGSAAYQKKLEVIAFLKSKGLDYYQEPIPDYMIKDIKKKYPDRWKLYVEKY